MCALIASLLLLGACAPSAELASRSDEVINGTITPAGMYPATGALMASMGGAGLSPSCSGTLIAPNAVLTAAHCVDEFFLGSEIPSFTLAYDANSASAGEIVAGVSTHTPIEWDLNAEIGDGIGHWYDIGLVILASNIEGVELEILPTPSEATNLAANQTVELVGYGLTSLSSEDYGVKYHGSATLVTVGDWELLISEPGEQQNCYGDSGGPGFVDHGGGRRLVGVVSRGPDQNTICDHGGIDTRVVGYLSWIHGIATDIPCGGLLGPCSAQPDAGLSIDAAPAFDATSALDAAGVDSQCDDCDDVDGDCACKVGGSSAPPTPALLLLALVALLRRRRRSPTS